MNLRIGTHVSRLGLAALTAMTLLGSTAASAGTLTINDTTAGGPTWNRPLAGSPPSGLSGVGTAVRYDVNSFTVSANGSYVFQSTATSPAAWDNFSFLYQNAFNAAAPLTNVLIGSDDNPSIGLSGFTLALTTGVTYFFVETGFANTDFGAYTLTITGPGIGNSAVPEPESLALFGIAIAAMGLAARRRKN